jgi:hypothetical protein
MQTQRVRHGGASQRTRTVASVQVPGAKTHLVEPVMTRARRRSARLVHVRADSSRSGSKGGWVRIFSTTTHDLSSALVTGLFTDCPNV